VAEELHKFELDLQEAKIQHEEWEVLFREKLLVERGLLQVMAGVTDRPQEPSEVNARDLGMRNITSAADGQSHSHVKQVVSLLVAIAATWFIRGRRI